MMQIDYFITGKAVYWLSVIYIQKLGGNWKPRREGGQFLYLTGFLGMVQKGKVNKNHQ